MRLSRLHYTFIPLACVFLFMGISTLSSAQDQTQSPTSQSAEPRPQLQATPIPIIDTPCDPTGVIVTQPVVNKFRMCPEYLIQETNLDAIASIASIAYAPSCENSESDAPWCGALFFVSPAEGTLNWIGDWNPSLGKYDIHRFAGNLNAPSSLAWHAEAVYVAGQQEIYRLHDTNLDGTADSIAMILSDLPVDWGGTLQISPDSRLILAINADCTACGLPDWPRGTVLSFALDGTDPKPIARGLRHVADLAWHPFTSSLFATDVVSNHEDKPAPYDEINLIMPNANLGWPDCTQFPDENGASVSTECTTSSEPFFTLEPHSHPGGLAFYKGDAFPEFSSDLLFVLQGQQIGAQTYGYALARLCLDSNGHSETCLDAYGNPIYDALSQPARFEVLVPTDRYYGYSVQIINVQQQGFFPEHPFDIAISPEGYITISILEGRIIQLTPVDSHVE